MASKTVALKNNNGDQIHPKTKANAVFLEDGQSVESKFKTIGDGFSGSYDDLTGKPTIPTALSELADDTSHRLVTDTEKNTWNNKSDFNGDYDKLTNKPSIPAVSSSTSDESEETAASSKAVKTAYDKANDAYDKANAAMPKSGGTFTGTIKASSSYQSTSTLLLRNSMLSDSEQTPLEIGSICWLIQ